MNVDLQFVLRHWEYQLFVSERINGVLLKATLGLGWPKPEELWAVLARATQKLIEQAEKDGMFKEPQPLRDPEVAPGRNFAQLARSSPYGNTHRQVRADV